jgi:hypothetical protein
MLDTIYTIPPFTISLSYPVGFILNLSPSKSNVKPFTPSSVKGLMILEAAVLAFLGIWLTNEYMNNIYMQLYWNSLIGANATTYTMATGLAIGLGGTVTAFTLWKNLREARYKLEHITSPRLRGSVKQVLSMLPTMDEEYSPTPKHATVKHAQATFTSSTPPQNTSQEQPHPIQTVPPTAPLPDNQDPTP